MAAWNRNPGFAPCLFFGKGAYGKTHGRGPVPDAVAAAVRKDTDDGTENT